MNTKEKLSLLWIFVMFNFAYGDILTLIDAKTLKMILDGKAGSIEITPEFLLGAAFYMELAMIMIVLSRILKYRINRWMNILIATFHIVGLLASMFVDKPASFYIFLAVFEIIALASIVWTAWKWPRPEKE